MRAEDDDRALRAIQMLLDRGWGRPITPVVTNDTPESLSVLHLIAARRIAETLQGVIEAKAQTGNDSEAPKVIDYSVPALE